MKLTKELASEILTGLESGAFTTLADEPAKGDEDFQEWVDKIGDLVDEHSPEMVAALAEHVQNSSEDVRSHEVDNFVAEHFRSAGSRVGEVLREYAQNSEVGLLYKMFTALDEAGAVDWFDWKGYADSDQAPLEGLHCYVILSTGAGSDSVFLFEGE